MSADQGKYIVEVLQDLAPLSTAAIAASTIAETLNLRYRELTFSLSLQLHDVNVSTTEETLYKQPAMSAIFE